MATVYSLICWGGSAGKSVTVSSSTDYVTLTNHGVQSGNALEIIFSSGTLPTVSGTALALESTYYAKYISSSTFELYYDYGLTSKIDFTSTGSSLVMKSSYMFNSVDATRYGGSTATDFSGARIYDAIGSWVTARGNSEGVSDDAIVEIADSFDEIRTAALTITTMAYSVTFVTKINGTSTTAFHNGSFTSGFCVKSSSSQGVLYSGTGNCTFDGLRLNHTGGSFSSNYYAISQNTSGYNTKAYNCIVEFSGGGGYYGFGTALSVIVNCIVYGGTSSTYPAFYLGNSAGTFIYNNLAIGNAVGFRASTTSTCWMLNNISIGNTVNWDTRLVYTSAKLFSNAGDVNDVVTFTATASSSTITFSSSHLRAANQPIWFKTTGSLPTVAGTPLVVGQVYYVKTVPTTTTMTISTIPGGTTLTFDGVGTGTHTMSLIWSDRDDIVEIDYSNPSLVFEDYINRNYRPASISSPQVDSGASVVYGLGFDILGDERPNYNNGAGEYWDVGPFEYDHGYGPHPMSTTLTFQGVVAGSEIRIYRNSDNVEIAGVESCDANHAFTLTTGHGSACTIKIVNLAYRIQNFQYTIPSESVSLPIEQEPDRWYSNPV